MLKVKGTYGEASIFTENIEQEAIDQILEVCNQSFIENCKIAIMPDVHAGKGCTIGTTIEVKDKVVPNLVGVDIGCGMLCIKLREKEIDFNKLDGVIRQHIPYGNNVRKTAHKFSSKVNIENLRCRAQVNLDRAIKSIGTLGGGNHFIEINKDELENLYLVIHTGSRQLGKQIAEYYQKEAIKALAHNGEIPKDLAYLEGEALKDYLHDIDIAQRYADENRHAIAEDILIKMNLNLTEAFTTVHNYIDLKHSILRKGAISAQAGERVIIPANMRDGSIIAVGKGNRNWNYSAPHGAGRILSRNKAKQQLSLEEFKETMKGVWSTTVNKETLDESPMAYKPIEEILSNINDTVHVERIIKPVYNFKAN